jgi:hypothetical protein
VSDDPTDARGTALGRLTRAFGRFWWDFLVGDTPELLVGAVAGVGLAALLCTDHALRTVAGPLLTLWVVGLLCGSLLRAKRQQDRKSGGSRAGGAPDRP